MNLYSWSLGGLLRFDSNWEFGNIFKVSRLGQQACNVGNSLPPLCLKISKPSARCLTFDKPHKANCSEVLNSSSPKSNRVGAETLDTILGRSSLDMRSRTTVSTSGFIYENNVLPKPLRSEISECQSKPRVKQSEANNSRIFRWADNAHIHGSSNAAGLSTCCQQAQTFVVYWVVGNVPWISKRHFPYLES